MYEPKVSIILTTYNSLKNLEQTYSSITTQDYNNIEIVVVDGGSTDGTIERLKEYEKIIKYNIHWISEPDNGIYDAMNKGLKIATGDLLLFFNDIFSSGSVIRMLVSAVNKNKNCIGAHGDLLYCQNGKIKRQWKMGNGNIEEGWMPAHPTLLLHREIFNVYGGFKTDYKCAADYEFMVRILKNNTNKLAYVPEVLVYMFYGGTSSNGIKAYCISFFEASRALKENGISRPYLVSLKRTLKVLRQFLNVNIFKKL